MKHLILILTLSMACNLIQAQENTKQAQAYSKLEVDYGEAKINLQTGKFEEMTKGVKVTLRSEDPDVESIVITSKTMTILTEDGASGISGFVMKGEVKLIHSKTTIAADNLEWSNRAGTLDFTGNVVADFGKETPIRADAIKYNLTTERATITNGSNGLSLEE